MKILFLTDSYPPEVRSASHLMQELVVELNQRGHQISVVTTQPRYNLTEEARGRSFARCEEEDGVRVIRVDSVGLHNSTYLQRGIAQFLLPLSFVRAATSNVKHSPDLIVVYSPPLTLGIAAIYLKRIWGAKMLLNIQDIFPQNAIDLGIIKSKLVAKSFEWLEQWIYRKSDRISVHSPGNRSFLAHHKSVPKEKLEVVFNWADQSAFRKALKTRNFKAEYKLESKVVVIFAGVLGPSQGLHTILEIADKLRDVPSIHFLFLGDGTKKGSLVEFSESLNLQNVTFAPFVNKEVYSELVCQMDIGLVSLTSLNKTPVVPGKILGYLAAGLPVLAVVNKESDAHAIVAESGCGLSFVPEEQDAIANGLRRIAEDKAQRIKMGQAGRKYAVEHFSLEVAADQYVKIFSDCIGNSDYEPRACVHE